MIKVYMQKITQHGSESYIGKIDPRILVKIATKIEMSATQDAQRPLNAKRVKEIANYVNTDGGILPNTLTIATNKNNFVIKKCPEVDGLYFTEFPDKESEFEKYADSIDVMDGQHRLYSFLPDVNQLPDSETYEIGFTLYDKPTLQKRRKIFISCNEKQEKVSPNLLLWFKEKLDMITDDDRRYYDIVSQLGQEYPLKNHIIMSAEKIKNGVKANQIIADLKVAKILDFSAAGKKLNNEQIVTIFRTYLSAWQAVVGFEFATSSAKEAGVAVKIAGLKYMIYVLPAVWDYSIQCKEKFTQPFVENVIKRIIDKQGVEYTQFFTDKTINLSFRDRTMIKKLSDDTIDIIKKMDAEEWNPLG